MKDFIAFDIWSNHASFRRGYTTTSPHTYHIPPKTSLTGLLAAFLGIKRENISDHFNGLKVSVQLLSKVETLKVNHNLLNTEILPPRNRTQIAMEYLRDPKYRIFITMDKSEQLEDLEELIKNHKSIFTPYLGVAYCIANFSYVGRFSGEEEHVKGERVISVVTKNDCKISWEEEKSYHIEKVPAEIDDQRSLRKAVELIYEESGNPIKVEEGVVTKLRDPQGTHYGSICTF
ncbi:MAG: type I-B CRISPR-associated protein Cas5b [Candidatus Parvarchaeota archaeon]